MAIEIGILIGLALMLFWGFGDFFMQKVIRKVGDVETLFLISLFGVIVISPFVIGYSSFDLSLKDWTVIGAGAFLLSIAAFILFEGMKRGKLDVVEPLISLELVAAVILPAVFLHEKISVWQYSLIGVLLVGLVLVSMRSYNYTRKDWMEKGTYFVIIGSLCMGAADVLIGHGSRLTDAFIVNWMINLVPAVICFIIIVSRRKIKKVVSDSIKWWKIILPLVILDVFAWLIYSYAMTKSPISIVTALSDSSIIIAVLLGMFVNKESLSTHQKVGLVIAIAASITLATIS